MSHLKERSEKNCLNCNAEVHGKYCHVCGQENIEPVESAWHLITHFFNDITHFDGKFFSTLKFLVIKPGFVSTEYRKGRRASYLNPVRMYIFTSAIFFLILFSINRVEENIIKRSYYDKTVDEIEKMDSLEFSALTLEHDGKAITKEAFRKTFDSINNTGGIHFSSGRYKTKGEYDSLLRSGKKKHNWLQRKLIYREIAMNEKYKNNQGEMLKVFVSNLMHSFPQMLFLSLPIFALILKLLYIRRKQFFYANHAIFAIHLYIFVFMFLLLIIGMSQLKEYLNWNLFNWLIGLSWIYIFYYQLKSMRNFYGQGWGKTFLKFILLNFIMLIAIIFLFGAFTFLTLFKV